MRVNLPLRYLYTNPAYGDFFLRHGLCPELGIDAQVLDRLPLAWHRDTAARLHQAGLQCAVHLPFLDLHPGSSDERVRQLCVDRLCQAIDLARIYAPAHCVAHLDFVDWISGSRQEDWVHQSALTWAAVLDHLGQVPLFLENVCESEPGVVRAVLEALQGRARMCFDLGHWNSFGQGNTRGNLGQWFTELTPWIGHVHLHDNDGSADQHLGLGQGSIPWPRVAQFLRVHPDISITLEPHTLEDFHLTCSYVRTSSDWVQRTRLGTLPDPRSINIHLPQVQASFPEIQNTKTR
ncbi:sugar phosphate isomerase/epimerase [Desulfovibrionales bacterium]